MNNRLGKRATTRHAARAAVCMGQHRLHFVDARVLKNIQSLVRNGEHCGEYDAETGHHYARCHEMGKHGKQSSLFSNRKSNASAGIRSQLRTESVAWTDEFFVGDRKQKGYKTLP